MPIYERPSLGIGDLQFRSPLISLAKRILTLFKLTSLNQGILARQSPYMPLRKRMIQSVAERFSLTPGDTVEPII